MTAATLTERSAVCAGCGCTWDCACPGGCAWNPFFWKHGKALCTSCSDRLGPICGRCARPIEAVLDAAPMISLKYRLLDDGQRHGFCRCDAPAPPRATT